MLKFLTGSGRKPTPNAVGGGKNLSSLRQHALLGLGVIAALFVGLGGWAVTTRVEGAVIASGVVVSEGGSRKVQYSEGGIVREILVQNNQHVEAGEVLIKLDDVSIRAELEVILSQLRDGIGNRARLAAESTDESMILIPAVAENWPPDPKLSVVMADQQNLRQSRRKALETEVARFSQLIDEKRAVIKGYEAQLEAYNGQLKLVQEEITQQAALFEKKLISNQRLNEQKRSEAELSGQILSVQASISATQASISELQIQADQVTSEFRAKALTDLQTVSQTVAELMQRMIATQARLSRLDIRAPVSGTVHESIVQTVGGVISPSETLMLIVPEEEHLLVDMRVSPMEINKLHVGQEAEVRMLSFDPRTTPNLVGNVNTISPDLVRDSTTGVQYFSVRVNIDDKERDKLPADAALVPGMPAESFFQTGERTVWSYLMAPIEERFSRTFREN
ncbi:HlyD family type I secretion periplasmic adaptor subunit [Devosia rhodophyticola]|uniref:Membrane fusion protein (MFP) family protein n=1 Tax=Devosia rhodophyticola TaxID=3026423 RepID=A0ABY7YYZ9_9HYPH|nr:HlyD family type I secretion periplasmic adaptor subunit [Devosia rhodophyticola]WDR06235.1 HlyD family type I secretion periplasmic adaptor subunit [Devosia rhodophyticola]